MLENFIVENLQDQNEESIIPMYEVNFKSTVPTGSMLQQMQLIYSIAKNHINVLSSASKIALDENEDYLSDYLEKMIKDQSKELADMRRIIKQVKSAGNDEGYLRLLDSKLHEKYKVKEKEYFAFTDSKSYKY